MAADAVAEEDEQAVESEAGGRKLSVLLVDDHPVNRRVVELMLGGVDVELTTAENGQEAVDACERARFDLVLMDLAMPVMDGLTATREIRRRDIATGRTRTPICLLTANVGPEHLEAGRDAGAYRHLAKPVTVAALLDTVGEVANDGVLSAAA